jgi:hypothetical protein
MRIMFGPKRVEVTEEWKRLQNDELNDVLLVKYYLADQNGGE